MYESAHPGEGIVIGIDPGMARTGYGILQKRNPLSTPIAFGCIETPGNHHPARRLLAIYEKVSEVLDDTPGHLAIEALFFSKMSHLPCMSVKHGRHPPRRGKRRYRSPSAHRTRSNWR